MSEPRPRARGARAGLGMWHEARSNSATVAAHHTARGWGNL